MTVAKEFVIIILSGIAFGVAGGLIGYTMGVIAPGYYRGVFISGREPWFDPIVVGFGLGVSQGLICGVIVGSVVILAVAWYNSRRKMSDAELRPHTTLESTEQENRLSEEQRITCWPDR